ADANPQSDLARLLPQFKRWYAQAGTPHLRASGSYDAVARSYTLSFTQSCAPTQGQADKQPFVIPVSLGLLTQDGQPLPLQLDAAFKELVLTLPGETYLAEQLDSVDPQRVHAVREAMREQMALALAQDWAWAYDSHKDTGAYKPDALSSGRRALAGMALAQLC